MTRVEMYRQAGSVADSLSRGDYFDDAKAVRGLMREHQIMLAILRDIQEAGGLSVELCTRLDAAVKGAQ